MLPTEVTMQIPSDSGRTFNFDINIHCFFFHKCYSLKHLHLYRRMSMAHMTQHRQRLYHNRTQTDLHTPHVKYHFIRVYTAEILQKHARHDGRLHDCGESLPRITSGGGEKPRSAQSYTHLCSGTSLLPRYG